MFNIRGLQLKIQEWFPFGLLIFEETNPQNISLKTNYTKKSGICLASKTVIFVATELNYCKAVDTYLATKIKIEQQFKFKLCCF